MEAKDTLKEITKLEAERTGLLGKEYLSEIERKRLVEIRQILGTMWEKRRQELNAFNPPV
jgi:hypothetical protein